MSPRKKITIAVIVFVAISIVMIVLAVVLRIPEQILGNNREPEQVTYVDPASGETIIETEDKTKEGWVNGPLILGFSRLLDAGLSADQFGLVSSYISDYGSTKKLDNNDITQISLVVNSLEQKINTRTGNNTIVADIQINRSVNQRLNVSYSGFTSAYIEIFDKSTNKLLYSSPKEPSELPPEN